MRTRSSARRNLAAFWVVTILMALVALLVLAGAAVSIATAQVPGKNGDLLVAIDDGHSHEMALGQQSGSEWALKSITPPVDGFTPNGVFAPNGKSMAYGSVLDNGG